MILGVIIEIHFIADSMLIVPTLIELPPKYYLTHFKELRAVLLRNYEDLLEDEHVKFLKAFDSFSEDAQCLYLRMMNRKGRFFLKHTLFYEEIHSLEKAIDELKMSGFIGPLQENHWEEVLVFLPKKELVQLCLEKDIPVKKSWSGERLAQELKQSGFSSTSLDSRLVVQGKVEELTYLLFLYFGRIQENLSLYTLRDLGIRQVRANKVLKARFESRDEARSHYFYARLSINYSQAPRVQSWPNPQGQESRNLRELILVSMGEDLRREEKWEDALLVLQNCEQHPGREKYIRLLHQLGHTEEAKEMLEKVLEEPSSDVEYLFAEDFYARKFGGRKRSILTETLKSARKIRIDESFFRHPEAGILSWFKDQGIISFHVENYVWNCLFGLIFWEELFESEKSRFFNEFERIPGELLERTFLKHHENEIKEKISLLSDKVRTLEILLRRIESRKGTQNGIFRWHESLPTLIEILLKHCSPEALAKILLHMGEDFKNRSTGFPDILAIHGNELRFYEIKAPGDSLKQHQLLQMLALQKAGLHVEVLQVEYVFNPHQLYVVVDLETTGGQLPYHRITEIGAVKIRSGVVEGEFQTLVNPGRVISREIEELTGITNQMVKSAPTFGEIAEAFEEFTKDCIFVAHNVSFDYGFLQAEFERLEQKFVRPYICTKSGMKKHYPGLPSYGLKNLCAHFNIPLVNHHRALADAKAASELLILMNIKRSEEKPSEER
jgi:DNA polymerase III subunit epsilon